MKIPKKLESKYKCECCRQKFEKGARIPNEYKEVYLCPYCFTRTVEIVMVNEDIRPALKIIKEEIKEKIKEDNLPF